MTFVKINQPSTLTVKTLPLSDILGHHFKRWTLQFLGEAMFSLQDQTFFNFHLKRTIFLPDQNVSFQMCNKEQSIFPFFIVAFLENATIEFSLASLCVCVRVCVCVCFSMITRKEIYLGT